MNAKQYNIGFIGLGLMGKGFIVFPFSHWLLSVI